MLIKFSLLAFALLCLAGVIGILFHGIVSERQQGWQRSSNGQRRNKNGTFPPGPLDN